MSGTRHQSVGLGGLRILQRRRGPRSIRAATDSALRAHRTQSSDRRMDRWYRKHARVDSLPARYGNCGLGSDRFRGTARAHPFVGR